MTSYRGLTLAILAGLATGAVFLALMEATMRFVPEASPWSPTINVLLASFNPIVPGFVAGFLASRRGFAVGAIAGLLTSVLNSVYVAMIETRSIMEHLDHPAIADNLTFAFAALIVGGICGIAGMTVSRERWNAF